MSKHAFKSAKRFARRYNRYDSRLALWYCEQRYNQFVELLSSNQPQPSYWQYMTEFLHHLRHVEV